MNMPLWLQETEKKHCFYSRPMKKFHHLSWIIKNQEWVLLSEGLVEQSGLILNFR